MTHLRVEPSLVDELKKNEFFMKHCEEFNKCVSDNPSSVKSWIDNNPDFFQMMMNMCADERIQVIDD